MQWILTLVLAAAAAENQLTLEEAVQTALRNNLEIEIEKTNQAAATAAFRGAFAYLDPIFRWQPGAETRNTPTGSVLASSTGKITENFLTQNLSFRRRTNWQALTFHADFENLRQSTNNPFTSLNPFLTPRFVFGVSLPLWRDRKTDRDRGDVILRRKQMDISDFDFELRVLDVVARVEQTYYDLVAARADVGVLRDSVAWAQEQLDRTKRMIEAGTVAPVELAAAEAELERRKDTFHTALAGASTIENGLKQLLAAGRDSQIWNEELIPTTTGRAAAPPAANLGETVRDAISRRVEPRALALRKDVIDVQRDQALNLRKPMVQLSANYLSSGLAGTELLTQNPFSTFNLLLLERINQLSRPAGLPPIAGGNFGGGVPRDFVGGYGQSLSNMFSGRYQTVQAGLTIDFNLRNSAAESSLAQAAVAERRIALQRKQIEQAIEAQIRNALQSIESAEQRIRAADASARAAQEKLDSEVRLFQTGESTNFLVLTRQNELSDSRRRVVLANLEFNKSVARLELARGMTLQDHGIVLK